MIAQWWIALRLSLIEQAHNRFAMLLLALYLPAWYGVIYGLTDNASIGFQLRAFHVFVATDQHRLGLLTGMLNATTLIMGFVALMHDPDVLLLDEPYQGFDWETYQRFWGIAEDSRRAGRVIVVISHLFYERHRFDTLLRLRDGVLTPEGGA